MWYYWKIAKELNNQVLSENKDIVKSGNTSDTKDISNQKSITAADGSIFAILMRARTFFPHREVGSCQRWIHNIQLR